MPVPVAPPGKLFDPSRQQLVAFPPADGKFACTLCGKCCVTLQENAKDQWPATFERNAEAGYYGLPTRAGLQVWGWERARMAEAARAKGRSIAFVPSTVIIDDITPRVLVLVWEVDAMACPLVDPGPAPDTLVCGAYEARPAVCRAFPVILKEGSAAYSSHCPAAFLPETAGRGGYARTFTDCFEGAEAASRIPQHVSALLSFLEGARIVRVVRGLDRAAVSARVLRGPVLDLLDAAEASGAVHASDFLQKLA